MRKVLMLTAVLLAGCASTGNQVDVDEEEEVEELDEDAPKPIALGGYSRYIMLPFRLTESDPGSADIAGRQHLDNALNEFLAGAVTRWNELPGGDAQSVTIEPIIEDMRFKRVGWRVLAGPFAGGGSYATVRLVITEQPSGRVVYNHFFSDSTNFVAATVTFGGSDNAALSNVAHQIGQFLIASQRISAEKAASAP